ncbi:Aldehyde/histidinol dehydrogenase [Leucosporidium creatinivorum]|uniref:Aldehyde/histidinol dehydrogenase n=1 Tax=Leucosporidium creatinivorum TaxID=106004 RepID=A0A1Y2FRR0_9BASI|nr:Aldehyde/histidinol dehydrogenase [Leucosporidium creatinivorum]
MSNDLKVQLKAVATAAADGTVAFPRFKQEQLVKLYNVLSNQRATLEEALLADVGLTKSEAEIELVETLSLVKRLVEESDFKLQTEKAEKQLREKGKFYRGKGVVVVRAENAAPIWSTIAPLATAISTGNAVVCLLPESTPTVSSALQTALAASLNRFAYVFTSAVSLSEILKSGNLPSTSTLVVSGPSPQTLEYPLLLNQAGSSGPTILIDRLLPSSPPHLLAHYARLIARASFHAQGRLPGSVHRVIVHQESVEQVLAALQAEIRSTFGDDAEKPSNGWARSGSVRKEKQDLKHLLSSVNEMGQGKILIGGAVKREVDSLSPTVITEPSLELLRKDVRGPVLLVQTFASHEDAFYLLDQIDSSVLHVFSGETAALEYIATESTAVTVYGNNIPMSALYDPHGALIKASSYVTDCNFHLTTLSNRLPTSQLARLSLAALPKSLAYNRTKFSNSILRVFFLQGVFLSLGTVATALLAGLGFGGWLAVGWIKGRYFV